MLHILSLEAKGSIYILKIVTSKTLLPPNRRHIVSLPVRIGTLLAETFSSPESLLYGNLMTLSDNL